jgi:hypothetical protein
MGVTVREKVKGTGKYRIIIANQQIANERKEEFPWQF